MKKLLYSIATLAVLCFAAGCQREVDIDPVKGELVETEFVVTLDDATVTKAAINNDAANIDKLIVAAFKKSDGTYLPDLNETNGNFVISSVENNNAGQKQFSVQAKLVRNFAYTIGFFAMNEDAPYTLGDDGVITMAAGAANDETLDAFYAAADITLDPADATTLSTTVTLTRPLAQINILSNPADWTAAVASGITTGLQSSISIAKAPNKLNLFDGAISGETTLEFTQTAIPEGTVNVAAANATAINAQYVAMAYVLSSASASPVDVTFSVPANGTDFTGFTRTVENVPNKRNFRTNLHGDLFTTSGNFTVVVDPNFGGNDNQDINIPQPTVSPLSTIPDDITSANPGIQKPTITTGNNVTTNMADGKLFFGIDTNSDGAITYSSSDHNVGTIDNSGVFTPVGPGTTNITVTQAAGTQTKAVGDPLAEITIVYHVTVEATEYNITLSAAPENGTVEIKNEAGDAPLEKGISGTKFTVVATPHANYNIGSIVVSDTDGNLEVSEGKYTIRTSDVTVTVSFVAMGQVATPDISPDGGYYTAGTDKATITCSEDGAAIYYTIDGTEPTAASTLYEGPIDLTNGTIKAIAIKNNMIDSDVAEATFTAKLATEIVLADQNMTFGGGTLSLTPVVKAGETTVDGATFTYTKGDDKVTVTTAGVVTAVAAGESSVKINATVSEAYLAPAEKTVAITIAKGSSSISWNDGALEVTVGEAALDLSDKYTKTGSTGDVTFAIASGSDYAHLVGNTIVADNEGSVTVNATVAADDNYNGATTTTAKTITVNAATPTTYTITIDPNIEHGTISADNNNKAAGETVTILVEAEQGYRLKEGTLSATGNLTITEVTAGEEYTFVMPGNAVTVTAEFEVIPSANTDTIADILEQITATSSSNPSSYSANLAGAVVTYVNGKYNYLEDTSGAIILYKENAGLTAGDVISGTVSGTGYKYNGLPQVTDLGSSFDSNTGGTIPLTTVTLATLLGDYNSYLSRRIKLEGVSVTDAISGTDQNGEVSQNASTVAVRASAQNTVTLTVDDIGDLVSFPALYNTTKQLTIYANSQFSKTGVVPRFAVEQAEFDVTAATTSVTVTITGNQDWTVSNMSTGLSADNASGNGNGSVTFSFAANDDPTQGKTYTATITPAEGTAATVTINQAEAPSGTTYTITVTQPTGGTIALKDGNTTISLTNNVASGIADNTVITLVPSASAGYAFGSWVVKDENNDDVPVSNNTFTMPAGNVTVTAVFNEAKYRKVTTITSGKKYLLVAATSNKALSGISTTSTKYGLGENVTITNNTISVTSANTAYQVTITSVGNSQYTMSFGGQYLTWTSGNSLNVASSVSDNTKWTVEITDGVCVFSNVNTNARQIWWNSSSPRFACYTGKSLGDTGYEGIVLYELDE